MVKKTEGEFLAILMIEKWIFKNLMKKKVHKYNNSVTFSTLRGDGVHIFEAPLTGSATFEVLWRKMSFWTSSLVV